MAWSKPFILEIAFMHPVFLSMNVPRATSLLDLSGSEQGAGGVGGLLAINDAVGGVHFCAYDGNGNVMALIDADDSSASAFYEYEPFGGVIRATGPMAEANPFRFSTKYEDGETDLLYYGYRFYSVEVGRWLNRDPLGEESSFKQAVFGVSPEEYSSFLAESLMPLYSFIRNTPVENYDRDGRIGPAVGIGVGIGLGILGGWGANCLFCDWDIGSALCTGQTEANQYAPDGSCHDGFGGWRCRGLCPPGSSRDGDDADLLTHCIGSCLITQDPGQCGGSDRALKFLQSREDRSTAASEIDWRNNNVGSGVGINIGPNGDCVQGCLDALNNGLLYTIVAGRPFPPR